MAAWQRGSVVVLHLFILRSGPRGPIPLVAPTVDIFGRFWCVESPYIERSIPLCNQPKPPISPNRLSPAALEEARRLTAMAHKRNG